MKKVRLYQDGLVLNRSLVATDEKINALSAAFVKKIVKTFPEVEVLDLQYTVTRDISIHFTMHRCNQASLKKARKR